MAAFDEDFPRPMRIPGWFFMLCLIGGAFLFFRFFGISGLSGLSIYEKNGSQQTVDDQQQFITYQASGVAAGPEFVGTSEVVVAEPSDPQPADASLPTLRVRNIRIASWAMDGFSPTKMANPIARRNLVRVVRQFDIIALQQIASMERDLVPRLTDAANEAGRHYDYLIGEPTGPREQPEQLAFIFDVDRVQVDRKQTYSVADPDNQLLFDPLVAWFRTRRVQPDLAWTFSLVNVRIDLGRAPQEVAMMPNIMSAVQLDGRGEDDVVMAGIFQADDAYLLPTIAGPDVRAAVRSVPTDIFGRHQTSNIVMDTRMTTEYIGRGGAFDFARAYQLSSAEAETITSHLPVFAEFQATEGQQP